MNFNFAAIQTIRKLAMTKANKHDNSILEKFKVENLGQTALK